MKTKHFLGMMAGAWMLASCSNQDELLQQEEVMTGQRVTVNAYVPDDTDSRLAFEDQGTGGLKVSWKETGETFSVMTADAAAPVTFTQTEGSEFAGPQGFEFTEGTQYYAFYPKLDEGTAVSATAVPYNIREQTGKLDESMNLMYAKRSANGDFQFKHMLAVMKFTLKGIEGKLIDNVYISFSQYCIYGTVNVTESEGPIFKCDYYKTVHIPAEELTSNKGEYEFYAYLLPLAADTKISIEAKSEDGVYIREYNDEFFIREEGIEAGKYYTATRTMDEFLGEGSYHRVYNADQLKEWLTAVRTSDKRANLFLESPIDFSGAALEYDNDGDGTNESNWPNNLIVLGTVYGGNKTITGIIINSGENLPAAPFSIQSGGVVENLRLEEVDISGASAGGIATDNYGTISGCSVSGSVKARRQNQSVGGIAVNNWGTVKGCCNMATVTGTGGKNVGGIVATNRATVTGCYNVATVINEKKGIGGIVGTNTSSGTITACYNTGTLSATGVVRPNDETENGGIAGIRNAGGTITACYWNATGADHGIGEDYDSYYAPTNDGATKVDGEVTWETAMETMNGALPAGFEWKWVKNTDENTQTEIPLVLQDVVK